jgi:hypothetical protein
MAWKAPAPVPPTPSEEPEMNPNTTLELTHSVVVVTDDHGHYRTECVCGWASDWYLDDDVTAEAAGADHLQIAVGPPDQLDGLLSELLDLQEDIAETVLWFADNYSADLPVPACSVYSEQRLVWLLAFTTDAAHIDRVAELTGSTPIEDSEPNDHGRRYRRVLHDFGRVRFETFTEADELAS